MPISNLLLFLIINFFHIYLGFGYFSIFLQYHRQKRFLFLTAWIALWVVLNLLYFYLINGENRIQIFCSIFIGLVLLISAVIFNLYGSIMEEMDQKLKNVLYEQQIKYYTRQYQEIAQSQEETRKMRHEMKNNYILIEALAEKGDTQGILSCVHEMFQLKAPVTIARTGNMVVDAVINYKASAAARDQIRFLLKLNIPTQFNTNDARLCGILGNALDNAMEACRHVPIECRTIRISMKIEKRNLFIEIINPYDGTILKAPDGNLLTRKRNAENHGYGLTIMKELLRNNFGSMETSWDDNNFELHLILYFVI